MCKGQVLSSFGRNFRDVLIPPIHVISICFQISWLVSCDLSEICPKEYVVYDFTNTKQLVSSVLINVCMVKAVIVSEQVSNQTVIGKIFISSYQKNQSVAWAHHIHLKNCPWTHHIDHKYVPIVFVNLLGLSTLRDFNLIASKM